MARAIDLTDAEWALIGPLLTGGGGRRPGRPALDGIPWRARSGARWRDTPERHGKWNTAWRRFARWRGAGAFEAPFGALAGSGPADERIQTLDSTVIRAHQHAAGAKGGGPARRWPLAGRVLDRAAPAPRRRRPAVRPRRGPRPRHALPDRRHRLRRGRDARSL